MQHLKLLFDKGAKFDILKFDIHAIASAMKLYLRELPDPLIPAAFYDKYLKVRMIQICFVICYDLVHFFAHFLVKKVTAFCQEVSNTSLPYMS